MRTIQFFIVMMLGATVTAFGQSEKAPKDSKIQIYITKQVNGSMEEVHQKVVDALKVEKFGVITEVDMAKILNEKLDVDVKPYKILGVCNPGSAYEALQAEPNIGVFLPCKVILKQIDEKTVEVVSANPEMMMGILENEKLNETARNVALKLEQVINGL
ncbi:MAG: DUF302 domain-containing protein [Bacteroidales bacterium]|nr:DUF302 domain-containing protein [Bacteroidales bacterium]